MVKPYIDYLSGNLMLCEVFNPFDQSLNIDDYVTFHNITYNGQLDGHTMVTSGYALKMSVGLYYETEWVYTDVVNADDEVLWKRRTWKGNVVLPKMADGAVDGAYSYGQYKEDGTTIAMGYIPYQENDDYYGGIYNGGYLGVPDIHNGLMFTDEVGFYHVWLKIDGTNGYCLLDDDDTFLLVPRYKLDVNGTVRIQGANYLAFGGDTTGDYDSYMYRTDTSQITTNSDFRANSFYIDGGAYFTTSLLRSRQLGWDGGAYMKPTGAGDDCKLYTDSTERLYIALDGTVTFNDLGNDCDFIIEGDTDANLVYVDAGNDRVGMGTNTPAAKLDINSDIVILRTSKTPASASATGTTGSVCWDSSYVYVCVATDTWKRAAIATW